MSKYVNLNRIEFVITTQCTSKCRHCSVGDNLNSDSHSIIKENAVKLINELAEKYPIESVMTFGGEPLLYPNTVTAIHEAAVRCNIPIRQIITNGYFTKDKEKVKKVAGDLVKAGVTSLLLSVDAFHDEHLPMDMVHLFASEIASLNRDIIRLHPAWVVNRDNDNEFNRRTEKCLRLFDDLGIEVSNGNNIFMAGKAIENLSGFYEKKPMNLDFMCGDAPYTGRFDDVETITINPKGDVPMCGFTIGNINTDDINHILDNFDPYENELMAALLNDGLRGILKIAKAEGIYINTDEIYTPCELCSYIIRSIQ